MPNPVQGTESICVWFFTQKFLWNLWYAQGRHSMDAWDGKCYLFLSLKFIMDFCCCSVAFMSDSLWPHGLQHARPPCPSSSPRIHQSSCPLNWQCHPTISSSCCPLLCLQYFHNSYWHIKDSEKAFSRETCWLLLNHCLFTKKYVFKVKTGLSSWFSG